MIAELKSVVNGELINVLVRSEPAGANVFVNQRSAGMVGVTPFTLKLMPGAHTIIVDTDGYEAQSRQVSLAKDSAPRTFLPTFSYRSDGRVEVHDFRTGCGRDGEQ